MAEVIDCITGQPISLEAATKLSTGKYVHSALFTQAGYILRKGIVSEEEIRQVQELLQSFAKALRKLHGAVLDCRQITGRALHKIVQNVIDVEHTYALNHFKKYRVALTKAEHLQAINHVLQDSFLACFVKDTQHTPKRSSQEDLGSYFNNVEHFIMR